VLEGLRVLGVVEEKEIIVIKVQPKRRRRSSVLTSAQIAFIGTAMQDQGGCYMLTFAARGYT